MWQFNFVPLLGGGMPKSEQNRGVATVYNDRAKFYIVQSQAPSTYVVWPHGEAPSGYSPWSMNGTRCLVV